MISNPIRFGIIGAEKRGSRFARALKSQPQAELVALSDI